MKKKKKTPENIFQVFLLTLSDDEIDFIFYIYILFNHTAKLFTIFMLRAREFVVDEFVGKCLSLVFHLRSFIYSFIFFVGFFN
jgi:hypothetical protein